MKSIKLNIKNLSDSVYVMNKQKQYSYAFRKLWNNYDKINDKNYFNFLKVRFNMTDIEVRSLISEVQTKFEQTSTNKNNLENEIINIETRIKETEEEIQKFKLESLKVNNKKFNEKFSKKSLKNLTRMLFKLNQKLNKKNQSLSNDIVFGGRKLLSEISYLNNNKTKNGDIIKSKSELYRENRILSSYFLGEANQNANRFFSFDFNNKVIIYKPNRKTKINIEFCNYKTYKKELLLLQEMIDNKSIALTVQLSTTDIIIMFDDKKLYGYALDLKQRKLEINKIKSEHVDKETIIKLIKNVYSNFHRELENKQLQNKLNYRYLSFDTNPDSIGLAILDKSSNDDFKIVKTFNFDLTDNNLKLPRYYSNEQRTYWNNKRRHGITHLWKNVFEIFSYYNCGYLVMENLDGINKNKNLDNKVSNRKVNNVWYRELSNQLIEKYCNKLGIIKIEINPVYSSFIGNLSYNFIDPINAAIEIGRRGIYKYIKNKFYPPIVENIISTMSKLNSNHDLDELRDVLFLKNTVSWSDLYRVVGKMGLRYRIKLEDISNNNFKVENKLLHSNIKKYCFNSSEEELSVDYENFNKIHKYA